MHFILTLAFYHGPNDCMEEWATSHSLSSMVDVKATLKLSENLLSSSYIIGFGLQYCPTEQCPCLYT